MEALLLQYGYLILFPISFLEGQVSTLTCGFLIWKGYFDPWIVFGIILLADIANDSMYYRLGRKYLNSPKVLAFIDKSHFLTNHLGTIKKLRSTHTLKTMILAKNAYIISVAMIASAGMIKMPFRRFLLYSIPAGVIQPAVLLFVGYHLGTSYEIARNYIPFPGIIILIIFIGIIIGMKNVSKVITKEIKEEVD